MSVSIVKPGLLASFFGFNVFFVKTELLFYFIGYLKILKKATHDTKSAKKYGL